MAQSARPLFVLGCYRSGTSLVRLVLNAHSMICIPQETRYMTLVGGRLHKYGSLAVELNQRRLIANIARILERQGWDRIPTWEYIRRTVARWEFAEVARAVNLYPCCSRKRAQVRYWGDKTPDYLRSGLFLKKTFPNALFIIVVRDGRDVAASALRLPSAPARNLEALALEWNEALLHGLLIEQTAPGAAITIRYEDLVRCPRRTTDDICAFLGIEFEPGMLRFHETSEAQSLSQEAHHKWLASAMSTRSIGRYKEQLSPAHVARLERSMFNGLIAYDYELDHGFEPPPTNVEKYYRLCQNFLLLGAIRTRQILSRGVREMFHALRARMPSLLRSKW